MAVLRKAPSPSSLFFPLSPLKLDYFRAYNALVQHPSLSQESPGVGSWGWGWGSSTWVSWQGHKQLRGRVETHTQI